MRRLGFTPKPARLAQAGIYLLGIAIGAIMLGSKVIAAIAAGAAALSTATAVTIITRRENDR